MVPLNCRSTRVRLEPRTGAAFTVNHRQTLRIVDPCGGQASDVVAFACMDTAESLSSGRTLDFNETVALTAGHVLYSNRSRPMFTITADTVRVHDFLLAPCCNEKLAHGSAGSRPTCFDNLSQQLDRYRIPPDAIPTAFSAFMNVEILPAGALRVRPSPSRAGDYIDLRAEMDVVVGVTACSAEPPNKRAFTSIDVYVIDGRQA